MTNWLKFLNDIIGGFSGDGGAAQDDSIKASLDLAHTDLDAIISKQKGTPASNSIDNLNVNTEQDLVTEVAITTVTEIAGILIDYTGWYADASITGTGATLTARVYIDDNGGTLREVTNLGDVITEGVSGAGMIKLDGFTAERNFKVTVQSSIAPTGGAGTNLVKYHYTAYDRE
jgi:hypothetical protein